MCICTKVCFKNLHLDHEHTVCLCDGARASVTYYFSIQRIVLLSPCSMWACMRNLSPYKAEAGGLPPSRGWLRLLISPRRAWAAE